MTQIGKECHQGCAIRQAAGDCVMPREGIFVKILEPGVAKKGDMIELLEESAKRRAPAVPKGRRETKIRRQSSALVV